MAKDTTIIESAGEIVAGAKLDSKAQSEKSQRGIAIAKSIVRPAMMKVAGIKDVEMRAQISKARDDRGVYDTLTSFIADNAPTLGIKLGVSRNEDAITLLKNCTEEVAIAYGKSLFAKTGNTTPKLLEAMQTAGDRLPKGNMLVGEAVALYILGPVPGREQEAELVNSF